ncbi:bifunctional DNA primase/polymerase [Leuconostoc gasicomitatum]|uniref:bifunctional DNA primase/polymerase n=1 Tax=Leuconostoc gasicomitatum TaxID=115778 RepID=UPI001CC417F3|nr:bifunctional DNA primase/polymerase [Leuconostoc gasicomitatum]MBZ5953713.1 bifunctional DNA primase/polymerase [Leuconostoc gasicomitatum]MBZ5954834.1 bifunctional DNA primase/polymerase [Leuconostoc gasicomitatum]MBZ5988961.1 bifunctional DNA primase/polymerase [Leuconostoc gasicomitatum]MBZ5989730.1 bifunctional DNA primase/polymerase [Leuconostoc gasicomitatum]
MNKWEHIKQYQHFGAYVFMALPNQKHNGVAGGYHNSFNNGDELQTWLAEHPDYQNGNIGIDLSKSNLVVVDIDKHKHNGMKSIGAWFKAHTINPETIQDTYVERTATGGLHAFYIIPNGKIKPKNVINVINGVDVLSDTAITVAPSVIDDEPYRAVTPFETIQQAPEWVYKLSEYQNNTNTPSNQRKSRYTNLERWLMVKNGFETGQRNDQAMSLAGYLFALDVEPQSIYDILQVTNERSSEPLIDHELNTIYMSARKREERKRVRINSYGRD